ncbi:hypothetical protein PUN28_000786 [Cardiocondyla obscurior]|uniref:Uncharacterized protein n=1 Tax=Cardiocondyla obscurior TaxID=286306 RepID=A0AAW2H123_9HYME
MQLLSELSASRVKQMQVKQRNFNCARRNPTQKIVRFPGYSVSFPSGGLGAEIIETSVSFKGRRDQIPAERRREEEEEEEEDEDDDDDDEEEQEEGDEVKGNGENGLFAVNDRNLSFRGLNGDRYLVRVKS